MAMSRAERRRLLREEIGRHRALGKKGRRARVRMPPQSQSFEHLIAAGFKVATAKLPPLPDLLKAR